MLSEVLLAVQFQCLGTTFSKFRLQRLPIDFKGGTVSFFFLLQVLHCIGGSGGGEGFQAHAPPPPPPPPPLGPDLGVAQ